MAISYSPLRPPAIPLAVRSPYTSAWSSTALNGTLNSAFPIFWAGQNLGWESIVSVDGRAYEWLGDGSTDLLANLGAAHVEKAIPLTVSYDSQYSNFTFEAGPVELKASFLSPVIPDDLCRTSIPLSYADVHVRSTDNASHNVSLYMDTNVQWTTQDNGAELDWAMQIAGPWRYETPESMNRSVVYSWTVNRMEQMVFEEGNDQPLWGDFAFSTSQGDATQMQSAFGDAINMRTAFVNGSSQPEDSVYRDLSFAFSHDLGEVSSKASASVLYTIGHIEQPSVEYLTSNGLELLEPWWSKCYGNQSTMIRNHYADHDLVTKLAARFEEKLKTDVYTLLPDHDEADAYYAILALSTRQTMAAWVLTVPPADTGCVSEGYNASEPLMFQKEISSNGNTNTVDVIYPALPFLLYANPNLLRYLMNTLFQVQECGMYPNGYSMHDLGAHFPKAIGHVDGDDEYMPVEENGNMIIMMLAYYRFTGDVEYLIQHYPILNQWADNLIDYSLVPASQLSTDDFAGELANQVNLALKGIVALEAMSHISAAVNDTKAAAGYSEVARSYIGEWANKAVDSTGRHTTLAYDWDASFGLLYNAYPDKLLDLGIVPKEIYEMQSAWYPAVALYYGVPLDSRHTYAKSDWEMWTAATTSPSTRKMFITKLAHWLNTTSTDCAFTDLYETLWDGGYPITGEHGQDMITFIARPVVGGHFSLLALEEARRLGGRH